MLEIGSINFPASPYNLSAFNLDSLRWFVQSMRGICKKMMGDYPGALKMITSSVENARFLPFSPSFSFLHII